MNTPHNLLIPNQLKPGCGDSAEFGATSGHSAANSIRGDPKRQEGILARSPQDFSSV